jgi:hypothetical protein
MLSLFLTPCAAAVPSSAFALLLLLRYGLVYPGIGWVIWREPADVPEDLVFHINYLGTGARM